ncbi:hypothetical protein BD410DRAFT_308913 [Rickenella mellea]|uniref:F-box domain-containing protein n=1 Tax=Rickenella mellea TaxID=50990 RepID=A0A4Y7Q1W3_9AGAM|nr:hypothetical protein BD410DRAFT_308913 [Rickenella mellea]
MAALTEIGKHLKTRIRELQSQVTPLVLRYGIARLPDEIVAQVFEMGHLDYNRENFKVALRVSHVSRRFRDIALRTPLLWTRIASWYSNSQVEAFLTRSRQRGLDLRVGSCVGLQLFFLRLMPHSNRISEIHVEISVSNFRELSIPDFPNLQVLEYYGNDGITESTKPAVSSFPSLTCLLVRGQLDLDLPLPQLSHVVVRFDMAGAICEALATALRRMSNLRELHVDVSTFAYANIRSTGNREAQSKLRSYRRAICYY